MIATQTIRLGAAPLAAPQSRTKAPIPFPAAAVLAYLAAITVIGKGPTYLGVPPLYWGEAVMLLGFAWVVNRRGLLGAVLPKVDWLTSLVLAYSLLGFVRIARDFPSYGLAAARDSAVWYYAAFYFIGAEIGRRRGLGDRAWSFLTVCWLCSLAWSTYDQILADNNPARFWPIMPWRGVSVFSSSGKELLQHMGLAGILVLGGLYAKRLRPYHGFLVALTILGYIMIVVSLGRAEKLAVISALVLVTSLYFAPGPRMKAPKVIFQTGMTGLILALLLVLIAAPILSSVAAGANLDRFSEAAPEAATGTALWRLVWWQNILQSMLQDHPVSGFGFGFDLAIFNPYLHDVDEGGWPVRSPHNINVTILSRMGIFGAVLFAAILIVGVGGLYRNAWSGPGLLRYWPERRMEIGFWAGMLLATWVNSTFGVLMEGPVLGIWFWFALGFSRMRAANASSAKLYRLAGAARAPLLSDRLAA